MRHRCIPRGVVFLFAVLGVSAALWVAGCRPRNRADPDAGYYQGTLPDGRTVQILWEPGEGRVRGELRSLATVETEGISATNSADGFLGTPLFGWSRPSDRGGCVLRPDRDGDGLAGFWRLPGDTNLHPVRFGKFATWNERRRSASLRFRNYGISKKATTAWPRFLGADPFLQEVNAWVETAVSDRTDPFLKWTRDELEGIWRWPELGASGEWDLGCRWTIVWRTNRLISLLEHYSSYTGGAHGNYGRRGANFQWIGGRLRELTLADFFRHDSGWQQRLAALVIDDLRRQKASGSDGIDADDPAGFNFTFTPQGLQLHFDPYDVGSYAEGSFTVHLPWELLAPYLPTNGMVRLGPTGVRPILPRSGD